MWLHFFAKYSQFYIDFNYEMKFFAFTIRPFEMNTANSH